MKDDKVRVFLKFEVEPNINYVLFFDPKTEGISITKDNKVRNMGISYSKPPRGTVWSFPNEFLGQGEKKGYI